MGWNEDRLHRWLQKQTPPDLLGGRTGHDAAVLPASKGRAVQCADQCVSGVHFDDKAKPGDVGRKVVARALSDLAATGAQPVSVLLTIAAGPEVPEAWLKSAIRAASSMAQRHGAALVGGDLALGPAGIVLAAFAHGRLSGNRKPVGRDRAHAGQRVLLSGPVGGSLLGRHLRIRPALDQGQELFRAGATAMMDVSDGLAWDLHRLARSSAVRIRLQHVPIHRDARRQARATGRQPLEHALHDGEDHVLIACMDERKLPAWAQPIGWVEEGAGLWLDPELLQSAEPRSPTQPRKGSPAQQSAPSAGRLWRPGEGGWTHGSGH